uniref:DDE Tnp4 domain-containing protein n=1 Tax=Timema monikensis TaxID=170555 RepID=A0A7R9HUY0_9NEOP|nr:unnamed protein product [Timema monikensis]
MRWFHDVGDLLGVVGCVDGTHIPIKNPGGPNAEIYRNRQGNFSMNVQRGGRFHDATIFEAVLDSQTMAERQYNANQIRTHNCVERTIGVWKRRFRCLTNTLETTLDHTSDIITATSVLHNIARRVNDDLPEDEFP